MKPLAAVRFFQRRTISRDLATIFLVTGAIGLGSHRLMKHLVERPLTRLASGIRTIGAGNYRLALPQEKRVEINTLIHAVNHMAREIDRRESDLGKRRQTLKNIIDSMPSVLVGMDPQGQVTQWNGEAEKITGIHAGYAIGPAIDARLIPHPQNGPESMRKAPRRWPGPCR